MLNILDLVLLIDVNNNGSFTDETILGGGIVSGASSVGGNVYQFTNVTGLNNNPQIHFGNSQQ